MGRCTSIINHNSPINNESQINNQPISNRHCPSEIGCFNSGLMYDQ